MLRFMGKTLGIITRRLQTVRAMKMFVFGFLTSVILIILGVWVCLEAGFADMRSDEEPPAWESRLMYSAVHASVHRQAPKVRCPFPITDELLIAGGKLYLDDCIGCHGAPGKPPSDFGATFYPRAPQFPQIGTQYSEAEVFWIAKHGIRRTGMHPQGPFYSDDKLWSLAAFITRANQLPPTVVKGLEPQSH